VGRGRRRRVVNNGKAGGILLISPLYIYCDWLLATGWDTSYCCKRQAAEF
jgi:hypothetical protein